MNKKLFGAGALLVIAGLVLLGIATANRSDKDDPAANNTTPQTQQSSPQTTTPQAQTPADSSATTSTTATAVEIRDMAFSPATITIKKGATVTWTNKDSVKHTVTMDGGQSGGPDSELLGTDEQYSMTFSTTGTFSYHCAPHPNMKGTVVVTE